MIAVIGVFLDRLVDSFKGLPKWAYWAMAAAGVLAALLWYHNDKVDAAYDAGRAAQLAEDTVAYEKAQAAAAAKQREHVANRVIDQKMVSKETVDVLTKQNAALARSYGDLKLRWAAHRSHAGAGGAGAVPGSAGRADAAACASEGWVPFDTAAATAEAADRAIAKDDAWIAWATAQKELSSKDRTP